jgi:RHS repeat-associated protein
LHYDAKGRLTNRTDNVATTLYGYDANDNQTSVTENGNTNTWTYDAYNRISSYRDINGNLIQYRYDPSGNLTNLVYPGGRSVYYAYDSNNHLTNVTDWAGRKSGVTYDLDGRLKSITRPNGTYRTIAYDAAGEATNILEQNVEGFPIALFSYNWNNAGEAQWEFAAPLPHTNTLTSRTMTYDADNRLHSVDGSNVTVDSDGNLLSGPLTNDTFAAYSYDARNRLQNVGGVTNFYDAINNRIAQNYGTNSTVFVVNPNSKLPQVLMRTKNGVTTYYVYGPGLLYQVTETATATNMLTYHYDYRGSTIALTDTNGNVTDRMEYSLYATLTYHVGTNDTPFLFNGRFGVMTDPNSLLYMRARYYNPYICRFINADPSGFSGGLNFYAYANGNPVSYLDPFGLGALGENSSISWIANGIQGTLNDINSGINAVASTLVNSLNQAGNDVLSAIGAVGQAQQSLLGSLGINANDPSQMLPLAMVGSEISVLQDLGGLAAEETPLILQNAANGQAFESSVINALGATKNTASISVDGLGASIPDLIDASGNTTEIKNVVNLSFTRQLQIQAQGTEGSFNLIVSPRTQYISGPLQDAVQGSGGTIQVFNPATGTLTPWP